MLEGLLGALQSFVDPTFVIWMFAGVVVGIVGGIFGYMMNGFLYPGLLFNRITMGVSRVSIGKGVHQKGLRETMRIKKG